MKRIISINLLAAIILFASSGCGNVNENSETANIESETVEVSVSESAVNESNRKEFKCFHSSTPDEKIDIADNKLEEFSQCYDNIRNTWELVSESTVEEVSETYGGLYYVVEEYSEGDIVSQMYLLNNIDIDEDVSAEYSEVMLFDNQTDTVQTMKCDNEDYSELYKYVKGQI